MLHWKHSRRTVQHGGDIVLLGMGVAEEHVGDLGSRWYDDALEIQYIPTLIISPGP